MYRYVKFGDREYMVPINDEKLIDLVTNVVNQHKQLIDTNRFILEKLLTNPLGDLRSQKRPHKNTSNATEPQEETDS